MLKEIFLYLTTPVKKELKKGHLYESIALGELSKEHSKQWNRHYDICKESIKEHIQSSNPKGICMVLGSGYCHDIPIEFLLSRFEKLILVDTVHPKGIQKKYKNNVKVQLVSTDLTSWASFVKNHSIEYFKNYKPGVPEEISSIKFDYIISDNVMSQLPIIPVNQIRKLKTYSEEAENELAYKILENHYNFVKGKCGVLITDLSCHFFEKNGEEVHDPQYGFKFPEPLRTWNWVLVPKKQTHKVGFWDLSLLK